MKRAAHKYSKKVVLGVLAAVLASGGAYGGYTVIKNDELKGVQTLARVIDGDTFDLSGGGRVRLLGLDAPEKNDCYFNEAKLALDSMLAGQKLKLVQAGSSTDAYGRYLRYAYVGDTFVNQELVKGGFAYTFGTKDPEHAKLLAAQGEAKAAKRGVWSCPQPKEDTTELDTAPPSSLCTIKGNISEKGFGKNYFLEGCPNYSRLKIDPRKGEQYFCSEADAKAAGYVKSESCDNTF